MELSTLVSLARRIAGWSSSTTSPLASPRCCRRPSATTHVPVAVFRFSHLSRPLEKSSENSTSEEAGGNAGASPTGGLGTPGFAFALGESTIAPGGTRTLDNWLAPTMAAATTSSSNATAGTSFLLTIDLLSPFQIDAKPLG